MPIPSIASRSILCSAGGSHGSGDDEFPMPAPSGSGTDRLDLIIVASQGWTAFPHAITGYTNIFNDVHTDNWRLSAWRKSADATPSTVTVTIAQFNAGFCCYRALIDNVDLANPVDVIGASYNGTATPVSGTGNVFTIPAETASANTLALAAFGWRYGWVGSGTRPDLDYTASGWTHRYSDYGGGQTNGSIYVGSKDMSGGGSTGAAQPTTTNATANASAWSYLGRIITLNGTAAAPAARRRTVVIL